MSRSRSRWSVSLRRVAMACVVLAAALAAIRIGAGYGRIYRSQVFLEVVPASATGDVAPAAKLPRATLDRAADFALSPAVFGDALRRLASSSTPPATTSELRARVHVIPLPGTAVIVIEARSHSLVQAWSTADAVGAACVETEGPYRFARCIACGRRADDSVLLDRPWKVGLATVAGAMLTLLALVVPLPATARPPRQP